jgi:hypothetical protein
MQWSNEEGQTKQWSNEEGQTKQWSNENRSINSRKSTTQKNENIIRKDKLFLL